VDYAAAEEVASSSAASQSRSKNAVEGVEFRRGGGNHGKISCPRGRLRVQIPRGRAYIKFCTRPTTC